jgi:hypothetical protein
MNELGIDNFYIELYENYSCSSKEELNRREGEIIRDIGNLNHVIAGRTKPVPKFGKVPKYPKYKTMSPDLLSRPLSVLAVLLGQCWLQARQDHWLPSGTG